MTILSLQINDELIDGISIRRNSYHFDGGKWEVHLSHRIGSIKDQFDRPIGKYTSGKGIAPRAEDAAWLAQQDLLKKLDDVLDEQNARPPQASRGLPSDEAELFSILGI